MHAILMTAATDRPQVGSVARKSLTALGKLWTAYTLKRAIADVASMSDRDYRAFGLDRREILTALRRLRDEIQRDRAVPETGAGRKRVGTQLAIVVSRRERAPLVRPERAYVPA